MSVDREAGPEWLAALLELARLDLLGAGEEHALWLAARGGCRTSRDMLIVANLRLVGASARRAAPRLDRLSACLIAANLGLLDAVRQHAPDDGPRFATYAVWRIGRALADCGSSPSSRALAAWTETLAALATARGRPPTPPEVAYRMALDRSSLPQVEAAIALANRNVAGAIAPVPQADGESPDESADPRGDHLLAAELARLRRGTALLDPRSRLVLELRLGLERERPLTLAQVGAQLDLTRERVRQLQLQALERLYPQRPDPGSPRPIEARPG